MRVTRGTKKKTTTCFRPCGHHTTSRYLDGGFRPLPAESRRRRPDLSAEVPPRATDTRAAVSNGTAQLPGSEPERNSSPWRVDAESRAEHVLETLAGLARRPVAPSGPAPKGPLSWRLAELAPGGGMALRTEKCALRRPEGSGQLSLIETVPSFRGCRAEGGQPRRLTTRVAGSSENTPSLVRHRGGRRP